MCERTHRDQSGTNLLVQSGFLDAQYAAIAAIHADGFSLDLGDAYTASKVQP